ncbi:hypothetical protein Pcar_3153 [Syntrophotalea carbinolica DSM 2380]|uniref:Uncharacterized protein n=1 Tax=Syntrophotalea carbinolica (strain DSM 2380 / NBRC 103641 / GraBd1) TaxID=338963 RepID=Q0C713_SYNC1|nr:hypothetical protein [Syntrophotalea carbinolica]ABI81774.1 hypothetical protein Pcar_3153 [Syntrophotalea carbinolica DSM 2380]
MARFRSIPTLIEAHRVQRRTVIAPAENGHQGLYVVYPGDYLCVDPEGRTFPCKAEDFERQYQPVDESDP